MTPPDSVARNGMHRVRLGVWFLIAVAAFGTSGCGGCRWLSTPITPLDRPELADAQDPDADTKKDEPSAAKPETLDFEPIKLGSPPDVDRLAVKPGHWSCVRLTLKPNSQDFAGDVSLTRVGQRMAEIELERTRFRMHSSRPVSLVRGQTKSLNVPVFIIPPGEDSSSRTVQINPVLRGRKMARSVDFGAFPATRLRPHQFYLVVLAANPDRYGFLKATSTVQPPVQDFDLESGGRANYLVTLLNIDQSEIPLPDSALMWTSIAYMVWDDIDTDALSAAQQVAILDWLHWGGQLIVSGPRTLEKLRSGFLREHLPAEPGGTAHADPARIEAINNYWSLLPEQPRSDRTYQLSANDNTRWQIIELTLAGDAVYTPHTGDLIAERRVGRGRILVTAFSLDERRFVNWAGFDGFLNGCLLRRPARRFIPGRDKLGEFEWKDHVAGVDDPRHSSNVRFFSRDASPPATQLVEFSDPRDAERDPVRATAIPRPRAVQPGQGYRLDPIGGVATWSDFNAAAMAAREALTQAAGVSVPNRRFVGKMLAVYLACLVPINWIIFRSMQKVELAWVMAPAISILGALLVVKLAQLDIGFVRSETEVSIAELQVDLPRAHLTRYLGLYSSLSTHYEVRFSDFDAVGLPFSTNPSEDELRLSSRQRVEFRQHQEARLRGIPVLSNSTGLIHSEQLLEMPGTIRLQSPERPSWQNTAMWTIASQMPWPVRSAVVLCRFDGQYSILPVGDISPNTSIRVAPMDRGSPKLMDLLDGSSTTSAAAGKGDVSLRGLYALALDARQLQDGDIRLVGWTDAELSGATVHPAASQRMTRTLLIVHLRYGNGDPPRKDANLLEEVKGSIEDLFSTAKLID